MMEDGCRDDERGHTIFVDVMGCRVFLEECGGECGYGYVIEGLPKVREAKFASVCAEALARPFT